MAFGDNIRLIGYDPTDCARPEPGQRETSHSRQNRVRNTQRLATVHRDAVIIGRDGVSVFVFVSVSTGVCLSVLSALHSPSSGRKGSRLRIPGVLGSAIDGIVSLYYGMGSACGLAQGFCFKV